MFRLPDLVVRLLFGLVCAASLSALAGEAIRSEGYPETTAALQERFADEMVAHRKYSAYARHALEEDYPAIAHLFRTLAASEAVHAENFSRLLREMGCQPVMPSVEFELSSTQIHLQQAATVEAAEIDTEYPAILRRIEAEQHEEAMRFILYAWKAEEQHRELILKIKKAASWFFGMLVSKIEGNPTHYFVCQVCGSTVKQLPGERCPICAHPPEKYREIPPFKQAEDRSTRPEDVLWSN